MFWERKKFAESFDVVMELVVIGATPFVEEVAEKDDGVWTDVTIGQRKRLLEIFVGIPSAEV